MLDFIEIATAIRRHQKPPWKLPDEPSLRLLILSIVLRTAAAAGLIGAFAHSGDICNASQAAIAGAGTAVLLFEKLGALVRGAS